MSTPVGRGHTSCTSTLPSLFTNPGGPCLFHCSSPPHNRPVPTGCVSDSIDRLADVLDQRELSPTTSHYNASDLPRNSDQRNERRDQPPSSNTSMSTLNKIKPVPHIGNWMAGPHKLPSSISASFIGNIDTETAAYCSRTSCKRSLNQASRTATDFPKTT